MSTETYYPPPAFYFTVKLIGSTPDIDASFEEVSGIQSELEFEEVAEGGENRFKHRLPRSAKYSNLILKRGVVTKSSRLANWAGQTIGSKLSRPIRTHDLLVMLLNEKGLPTVAWAFVNAYPVKWEVAALGSTRNEILTETLELSYNYFERMRLNAAQSTLAELEQQAARLAS